MHRYMAFLWNPDNSAGTRAVNAVLSRFDQGPGKWEMPYKQPGCALAHTGTRPPAVECYPLDNGCGVVIGKLFNTGRDAHEVGRDKVTLDASASRKIVDTGGKYLVQRYWGRYLAVIKDCSGAFYSVLRDPTGNLPCYRAKWQGVSVLFSDIEDCLRYIPLQFSVDSRYLAAHLIADEQLTRTCGLAEIEDVPGGERLAIAPDGDERTALWHPAQFCRDDVIESADSAASILKSAIQTSVAALAACHDHVALKLSGGLDSSIVAGCLGTSPSHPRVTCLNFYLSATAQDEPVLVHGISKENLEKFRRMSGHGDEREFARLVAKLWGFDLLERERRAPDVDLSYVWDAPIAVRPSRFVLTVGMDDIESEIVRSAGATAVFSGLAGDTVLYNTLVAIGSLDYAYRHPLGRHLAREIGATTRLSRESVWRVLRKTLQYGMLRRPYPPVFDFLNRPNLLVDDVARTVTHQYIQHPWIAHAGRLPPGKLNHVKGMAMSVMFYPLTFRREQYASSVNPLAQQPVVEACLRIPSYVLLSGATPRGLARRAFSDLLPKEVVRRTIKGLPMTFFQQVVRNNMGFVRDSLLDGALVQQGLLDRRKLMSYLTPDQPFLTVESGQLLIYLACEGWLRQWLAVRKRAVA